MSGINASVIGVRVGTDHAEPDWYTLWCDHGDGPNRIVTRDGRMQWSSTLDGARALSAHLQGPVSISPGELDGVCDIAWALYEISNLSSGNEMVVVLCLNLLDDMLVTVDHPLLEEPKLRLDRLTGRLIEGVSLPDAVAAQGGASAVVEAVLASVGRVFVWSDFAADRAPPAMQSPSSAP